MFILQVVERLHHKMKIGQGIGVKTGCKLM